MQYNTNIEDILNEETSSDEDPVLFDKRGYNKQSEDDKIRRMLQQKPKQEVVAAKIDFDQIEKELDSKYGNAKLETHAYTKEQLLNSSSEDDDQSSSHSGSPAVQKKQLEAQDYLKPTSMSFAGSSKAPSVERAIEKPGTKDRQRVLNELIEPSSDESSSDEEPKNKDKEEFYKLLAEERKPFGTAGQPPEVLGSDKQISIRNLGFDIDKALLEEQTYSHSARNGPLIGDDDHVQILSIVQSNEKNNEAIPEKMLQQANQLLSIDNSFYNIKNTLVAYEDYPIISQKLQQRDHPLYGVAQCAVMFKNFFFVGNSKGIVRVFNWKTQQEMMPLKDPTTLGSQRITCIHISEEANVLISGFNEGGVALWDLEKYQLLKYLPDLHSSPVTNVRGVNVGTGGNLSFISCEDAGTVTYTTLTRRALFGGYSKHEEVLFKERITGPASIAIFKPNKMFPHQFCEDAVPVAIGGVDNISIITLRPVSGLHSINKPKFSRVRCIPYMDWGFGLTPSHREKTVPILAFAWDRVIQLIYVNQEGSALEVDGFFYSDKEIISLHFVADSVLFAVFENKDGREVKVLYTPKFYPGSFKQLEMAEEAGNFEQFERVGQVTDHARLEKKYGEIQTLFCQVFDKSLNNYTNSIQRHKQNVLFLGTRSLQRARIHAWKEYIETMKEKHDWLAVLKVALEIYNGDLKGFAKVADEKEIREQQMKPFLKELLKSSIETVIYKFQQKNIGTAAGRSYTISNSASDYRADEIAIKVAIEFCLNIGATHFLFTEIFGLFNQFNLRPKLIANLEPFLISGQFKKGIIPEDVLQEFLQFYEHKDGIHANHRNLERIVQQIDLMQYSVGMRAGLEVFCEQHCMISALLHIQKSDKQSGEADIISTMYRILKQLRKNEKKTHEKTGATPFTKADVLLLTIVDSQKKYDIEKSYCYIGYKLLWIMKMYLEGRQFPYGSSLTQEQWKTNTLRIAELVVNREFVSEMLEFDPVCFLTVIQKLFYGEPFWFVDRVKTQLDSGQSLSPLALINKLKNLVEQVEASQLKQGGLGVEPDSPVMTSFYSFILNVHSEHQRYLKKMKQEATTAKQRTALTDWSAVNELKIDQSLILLSVQKTIERICGTISLKAAQRPLKPEEVSANAGVKEAEQKMIEAIQHLASMSKEATQQLLAQIQEAIEEREELSLLFLRLRIFLLERQHDYLNSFKLNLLEPELKQHLFEWIDKKFSHLDLKLDSDQELSDLKAAVASHMKELIESDGEKAVQLIEKWFDDSYSDQLIVKELSQFPLQQFHFLTKYLHFNEVSIKLTIKEAASQPEKQDQMEKYVSYLRLFVELMCRLNQTNPELVDESLIEAYVKQDHFPVEDCMEICTRHRQFRSIAVLQERDQDLPKAIETNMNYLKRQSLIKLSAELLELIEFHQTQVLLKTGKKRRDDRQKESVETIIRTLGNRWDFEECYKYKHLDNFDQTVQRAVDLAKRSYSKDGEGVFFSILLSLSEWSQVINSRLKEEIKAHKLNFDQLLKNRLGLTVEDFGALLEDFIEKRKNAILMKHVPYNISPETLLSKLNLDMRSIRNFVDYRVKAIRSEKKLIKMACDLLEKEILQYFLVKEGLMMQGYVLEGDPEIRRLYMDERLISKDVCDSCDRDIVSPGSTAACVFVGCGHTFHKHCVNVIFKESDSEVDIKKMRCPKCVTVEGELSLEAILESNKPSRPMGVRRSVASDRSLLQARDQEYKSDLEESSVEVPSTLDYSGYNRKPEVETEGSESLSMVKLDQFDKLAAMSSLTSLDFTQ